MKKSFCDQLHLSGDGDMILLCLSKISFLRLWSIGCLIDMMLLV